MDLAALKEKLGDETFSQLETYVNDLTGQRDQARNESITGRKTLKGQVEQLTAQQTALMDRLGIESLDDLDNLPDVKGAADAAKQYEAKLKRAERERDTALAARDEVNGKYLDSKKSAILAEALGSHEFLAKDVVTSFISNRLQWEGEDLLYRTDDGNLVTVKDGVAGVAKTRPELLKSAGTGGAGVRPNNAGGGAKTITSQEFNALPAKAQVQKMSEGFALVD